jgi:hypothetical protein
MTDHPFAKFAAAAWPHQFHLALHVGELHGGTPRDPDVVRSWLKAKAGWSSEAEIEAEIGRIFAADPTLPDDQVAEGATAKLADRKVNGFRRDEHGLYLEGRCLKACIKEGASVARATNKLPARWGATSKGVLGFVAEHVCVVEDRLYLGREQPDDLATRFVPNRFGTGMTVEEVAFDVKLSATVRTDYAFSEKEWAMILLTAEEQGLGSSRSQGYGRFTVTAWQATTTP